jgi:hypothetical protein
MCAVGSSDRGRPAPACRAGIPPLPDPARRLRRCCRAARRSLAHYRIMHCLAPNSCMMENLRAQGGTAGTCAGDESALWHRLGWATPTSMAHCLSPQLRRTGSQTEAAAASPSTTSDLRPPALQAHLRLRLTARASALASAGGALLPGRNSSCRSVRFDCSAPMSAWQPAAPMLFSCSVSTSSVLLFSSA